MLVVTKNLQICEGGNVVHQKCKLSSWAAVLTMVKLCAMVRHISKKVFDAINVPHETSAWIFDGEEDPMLVTQSAKLLGHVVKLVGCSDSCLQICPKVWQSVGKLICSKHRRIVAKSSFDESGSGSCAAWRCKVHVDALWMLN